MYAAQRRRINLSLFLLLIFGITVATIWFAFIDQRFTLRLIGYLLGAVSVSVLTYAYWRGWEQALPVLCLVTTLLVGSFIPEPFITSQFAPEVFIPSVIALVVASPQMVIGTGVGVPVILLLRGGLEITYLKPDNLAVYVMIVGGMALSRIVSDQAKQLAEANINIEAARQVSEQRTRELEVRNQELQTLMAQVQRQSEVIRELDIPLLPVGDRVLVMPLVGALDSVRLQHIKERALRTVHTTSARCLIIDVTGVALIDTHIVQELLKLIRGVQMLGTSVRIVGIRSDGAQTIAGLGLSFDAINVYRDLQAALVTEAERKD